MSLPCPPAITALLVVCGLCVTAIADGIAPRKPPPESVRTVESLFGEQIRTVTQSREIDDDLQLASDMLDAARMLEGKPSVTVLLCQRAYDLATIHPDGYPTAIAATELATQRMPEARAFYLAKQLPLRLRLYDALAPQKKPPLADNLIDDYLVAAEDRIAIGDFDESVRAIVNAIDVATAGNPSRRNELQAHMGRVRHLQRLSRQAESYRKLLEIKPHHEQAHRRLMLIHLVEFNRPELAIDHADAAGTATEKRLIPLATQELTDLGEADIVALGEFYRRLAADGSQYARPVMLLQAYAYFQHFHLSVDDPDPRLAIRARVMQQDVAKQLTSLSIDLPATPQAPATTQPAAGTPSE